MCDIFVLKLRERRLDFMKFVQVSDVHFDMPFTTISQRADMGIERRLDQRRAFKKMIEFVKNNNVDFLFITGDLYEQEYIKQSTIDYINNLFKEIIDTRVLIVPGNHDPLLVNSFYNNYNWSDNVKIFSENIEKVNFGEFCIYGFGFEKYELYDSEKILNNIQLDLNKFNILISHGDVYNNSKYNYISDNNLKKFDYVFLGHIHKRDEFYPGSLISLGFDEPGEHGFLYGEIFDKKNIDKKIFPVDDKKFIIRDFDISEINSKEDLIEKINENDSDNKFYEINLIGEKNVDTNISMKLLNKSIIKIKDNSSIKVKDSNDNSMNGIYFKLLKNKYELNEINEDEYREAYQSGLELFK